MNIFKTVRKELGFTQKAIAAETGVSQRTVSNWEHGVQFPAPEALDKLVTLSGISAETFIKEAGERTA